MVVVAAYYPMTGVTEQLAQWQKFAPYYVGDGVVATTLSKFSVAQHAPAGMSVDVASGRGFIQGVFGENGSSTQLTIAAADPTNPRIDRVVMRVDTSANDFELVVLTGTPAVSPTAAPLIRSATQTDYSLCQVLVGTTVSSIVTANVTDERGFASPRGIPLSPRTMVVAATLECFTPSALTEGWLWAQVSGTGTISNIAIANPPAAAGQVLLLQLTTAGATVVSGGNIVVLSPFTSMLGSDAFLTLVWDGSNWQELTRSAPAAGPLANVLVNGDFGIWQRGTSFASPGTAAYLADRWQWAQSGTAVVTAARDTSPPTAGTNAAQTAYDLKITVGTADAAIAATDVYALQQGLEGHDIGTLVNGFTLSWWVKAHRTGTYCVAFQNRGANRTWVAEYTVIAADTWEYKTTAVTSPPFTGGTWDFTTGVGLFVIFSLAMGSNFHGTAGSWQSSGILATSNQVNGVGATTDTFQLALVNLIPGTVALPVQPVPSAVQLERCQRYCQVFGGDAALEVVGNGFCATTLVALVRVPFLVPMQGVPTLTVSAAADWAVEHQITQTACTAVALSATYSSTRAAGITATVAAGLTAGEGANFKANSTTAARLTFEANPA